MILKGTDKAKLFNAVFKLSVYRYFTLYSLLSIVFFGLSCSDKIIDEDGDEPKYEFPDSPAKNKDKPRFIWIDAAANFSDFANNKENITRDLKLAKDVGFTDVVVDIRQENGDILFKSTVEGAQQVDWLPAWVDKNYIKVYRTASFDYLQEFIDRGHALGLRIHAGFNVMSGGKHTILGSHGLLFRDPSKKEWATYENLASGITNSLIRTNNTSAGTRFFNPANEDVQNYIVALLKDLAKYNLDGIVLDRMRFEGIQAGFSESNRHKFEAYLGVTIPNYPADILPPGTTMIEVMKMETYPRYFKQWVEFRAKVIYDFMEKARDAVKETNPKIKFGAYVGGWYSDYYEFGVNWGSNKYNAELFHKWATPKFKNYGYAALMDQMIIGAYAKPKNVYGDWEWSMQGFCKLAVEKIQNKCPLVVGGPDVGNWDPDNVSTQAEENQAIVNSVAACMDECDGYFLFDMIHLKWENQWQFVKEGIDKAIK